MQATGSNMVTAAGYFGGDALRATGPVVAGGLDAIQSTGIGEMLTPDEVPPAVQPEVEP